MLSRLEIKLQSEKEISYAMSTLFHGALMELLPGEYADELHLSKLHPYTQHLEMRKGEWYWIITCLTKVSYQYIIEEALEPCSELVLKKHDQIIKLVQKTYSKLAYKDLMEAFYELQGEKFVRIQFLTPTAFKQRGHYLFYPDVRCLYQSLMNKYDSASAGEIMTDEDALEQLCEHTKIHRYDLKSTNFYLEGTKVPGFIGSITLRLDGTKTMNSFAKMLFEFGEYSGVGIKTTLGMGALKLITEGGKQHD